MKSYIERLQHVFNKGNRIDKFNVVNYGVFGIFSIASVILYRNGFLKSVRFGISDTITVSSIILGILGIFIGILIGQHENSNFFRAVKRAGRDKEFFGNLMMKIRNQFFFNIVFIIFTLLCDFLPAGMNILLKSFFLFLWVWLFMVTLWGVFYIVDTIVVISVTDNNFNNSSEPRHK
ncbi:hypothetical protein [Lactiplantibacillus plantarum]|uniref:hypothetical protein n=1 Tax=Lactiplantibacillus plantarum TaxID=1590 RepID=UPI0006C91EBD|nr:hypothetical protein [Lactiplantibacillus plantarum]MBT9655996.1 hypothetical protein [Lactiplantibacillus plantarum]QXD12901.1 hypothetical protein N876_05255 [Lactiplantibacillus plantarum 2025]